MGGTVNNPKPSARPQVHYRQGCGYVLIDGQGREVSGFYGDRNKALMALEKLVRDEDAKAKRGPRACLCCGASFQSEGIHNRMCDRCRHRDVAPDPLKAQAIRDRRVA